MHWRAVIDQLLALVLRDFMIEPVEGRDLWPGQSSSLFHIKKENAPLFYLPTDV
jgi:hypothetical protein